MKEWMIFHSSRRSEGGPWDFHKGFETEEEARRYGLDGVRYHYRQWPMDIIVRLAKYDGKAGEMTVVSTLNIPDTEQMVSDKLEWR